MNFDYSEADEYEADFIAAGQIEFDELEDDAYQPELSALAQHVRAARCWA
jgi:hypothetical protein